MSIIVTDAGFAAEDWTGAFVPAGDQPANDVSALDVPSDADPEALAEHLATAEMIRVDFPSFADGRGFTIGRRLRQLGYKGRLRAKGHVLADQYAMARRSGFDEVEIDEDLAARQPQDQWRARADWQSHDYQSRLRG